MHDDTRAVHLGRHPERADGAVNPPVIHASTIIAPTLAEWESRGRRLMAGEPGTFYGRFGTATHQALEEALTALEGGFRTRLLRPAPPARPQSCHRPADITCSCRTRTSRSDSSWITARAIQRAAFYDPGVGADIEALITPNTRVVYLEAPGSITFEMQDIPAIAEVAPARRAGLDGQHLATPCYFKPLAHGVDISIQAATKYVGSCRRHSVSHHCRSLAGASPHRDGSRLLGRPRRSISRSADCALARQARAPLATGLVSPTGFHQPGRARDAMRQ
jgi:cystathionine beta-lyase